MRLGWNKRSDPAASVCHIFPRHGQRHERPRGLGTPIALRRREPKPHIRLNPGLRRSFWHPVEAGAMVLHADTILGSGVAQVRRHLHPHPGLGLVASHALARPIHDPEVELRQGMALVRRLEIPMRRLRIILRRALLGKLYAEAELRLRIAVVSPGFGSFPSRLLRAAEQSAKEQFVHARDISRPELKHKNI